MGRSRPGGSGRCSASCRPTRATPSHWTGRYFLGVEGAGAHPYRLLRDAMKQSGQVGVARMALRGPERLVVLREQPPARNISAHAEMGARYSPTSTPPRTKPGAWRMLPARWGSPTATSRKCTAAESSPRSHVPGSTSTPT
ncbi:Ku protein [Streptomyces lydicus]|uniref:Ku protein n=1 Tax=Streptomyces lydicus TaxID=47763 RepID=UPI0036B3DD36